MTSWKELLATTALLAVVPLAPRAAAAATDGSFAATDALHDGGRQRHEALRLPDGRVLVIGGSGANGASTTNDKATVEAYEPTTETWSALPSMAQRRVWCRVRRLPDGRVLAIGGGDYQSVWSSTEVWDPANPGAWTAGPSMNVARHDPVAVTLADGRILVAGGWPSTDASSSSPHTSAEVFDPATGVWSMAGSMVFRRSSPASVLLADGRVLVTGGHDGASNGYQGTTQCQLYDPATGTWAAAASMGTAREAHRAVRLHDGRVLVVGGGANASGAYVQSTEIYDPAADAWTSTGSVLAGGSEPTLTLLADGSVLAAGGIVGNGAIWQPSTGAALFQPATSTWTALGTSLVHGRWSHTATLLADGRVLLAGGWTAATSGPTDHCELFAPTGTNQAPTAHAGADDSRAAGSTIALDGSGSFDDQTASAALLYAWTFTSRPAGSGATLSGGATATPSFTADVPGTYVVALVVTDEGGLSSSPDEVVVASTNLPPTPDAGLDQVGTVGVAVGLAGSAHDPEGHAITYTWRIASAPAGSTASFDDATSATPTFVPDVPGTYTFELVAGDPYATSAPDTMLLTAQPAASDVGAVLADAQTLVRDLPASAFDAPGHRHALQAQLRGAAEALAVGGDVPAAIATLERLVSRTDGWVLRGALDTRGAGKDWVVTAAAQQPLYDLLREALDVLGA
jgi:N-acetylneuraminic acid mutarotase